MIFTTLVIIVVIAVIAILVLRARSESRPEDPLADFQAGPQPSPRVPDVRHIAQLLLAGKKIEAIKAYMDLAGRGLENAKNAVDRYDPLLKRFEAAPSPPSFDSIIDWSEIDALLEQGDKIGAIRLYRQKAGCDLKEARYPRQPQLIISVGQAQ